MIQDGPDPKPDPEPSSKPDEEGSRVRYNPILNDHPIIKKMRRNESIRIWTERSVNVIAVLMAILTVWLAVKLLSK